MNEDYDLTAKALFNSLLSKSFERTEEQEDEAGAVYRPPLEGIDIEELPLLEEEDRDILMHRDAHFSKNFDLMLKHYEDEGVGAVLDVEPEQIASLMELEMRMGKNLAPYLLQGPDAEKVAQSIRLYKALQEQLENKKAPLVGAISELILSEEENEAAARKAAKIGPKLIPYLMQLLQTAVLFDPLFPGYGMAPIRACLTLGKLQAKEAIKNLFELIGTENFDTENASIQALCLIGEPAREFCLNQLASRPITKNNERAAIVLSSMDCDDNLALALLEQLEDKEVQKRESLASYLAIGISRIPGHLRERFTLVAEKLPPGAREEIANILKSHGNK